MMIAELERMFDDLGEPPQVLTAASDRPIVVHRSVGQMTLITQGSGYALLGDQEFEVGRGDLLILAPGCEHAFHSPDKALILRHWHWPQAALADDRHMVKDTYHFAIASR
ncbi:MAG: AraC family ligand binding domain-containing protein [Egibacteraceae bacterium]